MRPVFFVAVAAARSTRESLTAVAPHVKALQAKDGT